MKIKQLELKNHHLAKVNKEQTIFISKLEKERQDLILKLKEASDSLKSTKGSESASRLGSSNIS